MERLVLSTLNAQSTKEIVVEEKALQEKAQSQAKHVGGVSPVQTTVPRIQ